MRVVGTGDRVLHVRADQRSEALPATPGVVREEAIAVEGMWGGLARTEAGTTSAWHHHGDYDTAIYIVSGSLRMESGPGGTDAVEAHPGDFLFVPKGLVHREGNPGNAESHIVVVRAGSGPPVINVDGPEPG
jgi:uncharacterized RmlC-like cupin family protein